MEKSLCPECDHELAPGDQTCPSCGEPLSYRPEDSGVPCQVCREPIDAYTETCPHCGEKGYPALRPRKGRHFKGSPRYEGEEEGER